jgi:uncharacterized protein (TIGR02118 family)
MTVLRVLYRHGVKFDEDYYVAKHLPLVRSVFQSFGLRSIEVMRVSTMPDLPTSTYQFIFSAYFDTQDAVQAALHSPQIAPVLRDVSNFFPEAPEILIGEIMAQAV